MSKARAVPYPPEFRQKVVDLFRAGRSMQELAAQFRPSERTIRNWVAQVDANESKRKDLLTSAEREELVKLRVRTSSSSSSARSCQRSKKSSDS